MEKENKVLNELISLKNEWDRCLSRINEIQEELKPIIVERLKQLNYKEVEQDVKVKIAPRKFETKKVLVGMINWNEDFIDEDADEVITIERSRIVMADGVWSYGALSLDSLINF